MTSLWTAKKAEKATNGKSTARWKAGGVSIDSRSITKGDLFVAIVGPNHDGHDYLKAAAKAGAAAAMVDKAHAKKLKKAPLPLLVVKDTLKGLVDLAAAARKRTKARVIAVTGSVGKTGTKESLAKALSSFGRTHATLGNLNNDIGLPLTMARMPKDTEFAVLEMGMNHPGEIAPLSELARPHIAVITTVQAVHLEFFDSVHDIADAKAEIFQGLGKKGTVLLPRDHPLFHYLRSQALCDGVSEKSILGFGAHWEADIRLADFEANTEKSHVEAVIGSDSYKYDLAMPGRHWAVNSLIVLGVAERFGLSVQQAADALIELKPSKGRGARAQVTLPKGGSFTLIDESYNASPAAMKAAFKVLGESHTGDGGRRIAILGDMLELGEAAAELHAGLARDLAADKIDRVYTVGPVMAHLRDALPKTRRAAYAERSTEIINTVLRAIRHGDVVMIKGSLGTNMAPIVQALLALNETGKNKKKDTADAV
ncbi:UDP-N-acetylmuramoyl-tripeptide--D-alanyl-D-alanine ligase [Aestuariispira insulae]|uniref:UDP-N-acetylmuramoyl-tripeptide--D-alanyl-D-alanine ligase n=1 Tax=Aestuariispira insulae TaxID=1461337 RepID=A0A3D9HXG9_9PROT|nr:UDP-N-acetylmuramoyl-tripeptide--D-alanyl-D-alanine ligase [Aestuariispira insulae]RED54110.1 UDP-N-acetylmuramoyl-tripeptide--D-alanyl-D-alanine ligase [Aestuariispira insulae]